MGTAIFINVPRIKKAAAASEYRGRKADQQQENLADGLGSGDGGYLASQELFQFWAKDRSNSSRQGQQAEQDPQGLVRYGMPFVKRYIHVGDQAGCPKADQQVWKYQLERYGSGQYPPDWLAGG